ncbi:growth arrest-specific 2 like 1 (predicted), isoform CRA_a [Rattus norvegicus]|uniref:Growth arrest-specific 2 like 1 (Predicted), isoform CRA_a n=1 Tax=Rattus norvegicus TaxID=10116 RepID=A6IKK0_RAT|nr:growth arrest-specific 2 like 1 (predicted), isoform CRA_a [Rattus norvegicus]|eukprot:NP_001101835.1 GAS2-like protein 1 [Rattus norvegicus]
MADPVAGIAGSAAKSVRPFRSSEAYVEAMKEDLADWLNALYSLGLPGSGDGFLTGLATGTTLCQHANAVTKAARALAAARPTRGVAFQAHSVAPGSFMARDNVASFIGWCRAELGVPEVLMFETEDLVLRKNEKSVVLCLLEVARRGARLGLLAPRLVQFEQEIERELRATPQASSVPAAEEDVTEIAAAPGAPARTPRMTPNDIRNLDELVREILGKCTCPDQFPMIKVSEGKYRVGDSSLLIFVRVLRNHVMVRVGGGWDTLEHYLDKHDPCRCTSSTHRLPQQRTGTFSPQRGSPTPSPRPGSPVPGSERRSSRPEVTPISLRSTKEGPETPLRSPGFWNHLQVCELLLASRSRREWINSAPSLNLTAGRKAGTCLAALPLGLCVLLGPAPEFSEVSFPSWAFLGVARSIVGGAPLGPSECLCCF